MAGTRTAKNRTSAPVEEQEGFTAEERAAMKEHATELRAASRRRAKGGDPAEEEAAVLEKIAELPEPDRSLAQRIHELVRECAPQTSSRLWYGMPAYTRDGQIVCFFQPASKFKARYATLGFSDKAALDDGAMWPTSYAVTTLTPADEERIVALVRRAVG